MLPKLLVGEFKGEVSESASISTFLRLQMPEVEGTQC